MTSNPPHETSDWLPITTAPTDGTRILARIDGEGEEDKYAVVRWEQFFWCGYWTIYRETEAKFFRWLRGSERWLVVHKAITGWKPI